MIRFFKGFQYTFSGQRWTPLNLKKNKMQPSNPNAHTYVNGTDVETHGYAVTQNTFVKQFIWTVLYIFPLLPYQCTVDCGIWKKVASKVWSVECRVWSVKYGVYSVECQVSSAECKV